MAKKPNPDAPSNWTQFLWRFGEVVAGWFIKIKGFPQLVVGILALTAVPALAYVVADQFGYDPIKSIWNFSPTLKGKSTLAGVSEPTIRYLSAYVTLEGSEQACKNMKCSMKYYASGSFEVPPGQRATYDDRIKAAGKIVRFETFPPKTIRNEQQFQDNPTYLEYRIVAPHESNELQAQVELVIENPMTPTKGKVGLHFPYRTVNAAMIVDFRRLGFRPIPQMVSQIEAADKEGILQEGVLYPPQSRYYNGGNIILITAQDIPPNSSFVLRWPASN